MKPGGKRVWVSQIWERNAVLPPRLLSLWPRGWHQRRLCPWVQQSCRARDPKVGGVGGICKPDGSLSEGTLGLVPPLLFTSPMGPVATTRSEDLQLTLKHPGSTAQCETIKYRSPVLGESRCLWGKRRQKVPPLARDQMLSRSPSWLWCLSLLVSAFVCPSPPSFLSHHNASQFLFHSR